MKRVRLHEISPTKQKSKYKRKRDEGSGHGGEGVKVNQLLEPVNSTSMASSEIGRAKNSKEGEGEDMMRVVMPSVPGKTQTTEEIAREAFQSWIMATSAAEGGTHATVVQGASASSCSTTSKPTLGKLKRFITHVGDFVEEEQQIVGPTRVVLPSPSSILHPHPSHSHGDHLIGNKKNRKEDKSATAASLVVRRQDNHGIPWPLVEDKDSGGKEGKHNNKIVYVNACVNPCLGETTPYS
jgi:hypothetical protein